MRWTLLLLALAACSGSPATYTFPGCEDAGGPDTTCGNNAVFTCAELHLEAQYSSCTQDSDCAFASVNESCVSTCGGISVRADSVGVFTDAFSNEAQKFCKVQQSNGSCGGGQEIGSCFGGCVVPSCVNGACGTAPSPDGGCGF
ncbi:MAG: hypothetical protein JST54_32035 [Deltaproteobacteria bacterium]|nr:hypothetical protein [Deltaproteobacteria bacterium]